MENGRNEEILSAIKTGNNGAVLSILYKTVLPKIIRFIVQNNGDEEEAKDIFQDAVVTLFNTVKLGKYDEQKDVSGFIYFVSRNLWVNRIKKRNKSYRITDTDTLPFSDSPLACIISEEKENAIRELMDMVGEHCRTLLKYTMHDQLSMKEIAEKMGMAGENVAKSAHYRCKQKLITLITNNRGLASVLKG